jgi:hypothetical protein
MAIAPLSVSTGALPKAASTKETFAHTFKETAPLRSHLPEATRAPASTVKPTAPRAVEWARSVEAAQARLDHVLALSRGGKTFTPVELLGFQAQVYRASQQLDLASRVVEKTTSGVKQVLQTQA